MASPSQSPTFFYVGHLLGRAATAGTLGQTGNASRFPGLYPGMDRGIANGEKRGQLPKRVAPVVPQNGLSPPPLTRVWTL